MCTGADRGGDDLKTKEFVAGLDIFECASLDEAIQAAAKSPVARYHPMEIRPFAEGFSDGPFIETREFIAGIDVVRCADRQQAIELAAAHPVARYHAIEVRPFYVE